MTGETALSTRDNFVDEAGDAVLFNRAGRICIDVFTQRTCYQCGMVHSNENVTDFIT
jgi:hypothetical protein